MKEENDQNKSNEEKIRLERKLQNSAPPPTVQSVKKGLAAWWDGLSDEGKSFTGFALAVTGFVVTCMAVGAVTSSISAANHRATLNSPGFKSLLERGLLDPVPPPKTLEEAAARIIDNSPRILPMGGPAESGIYMIDAA